MTDVRKNVLLIFIKNPERGNVKTRLAKTLGEQAALEVYRQLLTHTRNVTKSLQCRRQLWYSDYIDNGDSWEKKHYEKKLQKGNDLGERMKDAFRRAFGEGAERVVVIGSDCAELTSEHIRNAFRELKRHEIVIGPSRDGGYYLLGMTAFYPALFEDIPWSTSGVYDETVARIKERGRSYEKLALLNDIDTKEDLLKSGKKLEGQ